MPFCNYCEAHTTEDICEDCEELHMESDEEVLVPKQVIDPRKQAIREEIVKYNKEIATLQQTIDDKVRGKVRDAKTRQKLLKLHVRFLEDKCMRSCATVYDVMTTAEAQFYEAHWTLYATIVNPHWESM